MSSRAVEPSPQSALEYVRHIEQNLVPVSGHSRPPLTLPQLTSVSVDLPLLDLLHKRNHIIRAFCGGLLSHSGMSSKVIHVVAGELFIAQSYSLVWIHHVVFIHLSLDRDSNRIYSLALTNNAICTFTYKRLCGRPSLFLLGISPAVELLGHVITLCLTFGGTDRLFSKVAAPFSIPTNSV